MRTSGGVRRLATGRAGMSLVEATVILGVVSMLTAVLAPAVRNYVQGAQQAAARGDVEAIAAALTRLLTDVGETFVLRDGRRDQVLGSATDQFPPSHAAGNRVDLL